MHKPKSIVIADKSLQAAIAARGDSFNAAGNTALERYFEIIASERNTLRKTFTQAELSAILDACNGVWHSPITMGVAALGIGIGDALELDGLAAKWQIDGDKLLAKIEQMTQFQHLALIDWIERTWANHDRTDWSDLKNTI